ncbi:MAG: hypothetical protein ACYTEV_00150 [Planctomycetota bacterium]
MPRASLGSDPDGPVRPRSRRWAGGLMAVAGLGLLLWARLILVSDMPRMALAEPEAAPDAEVAADEPAVGADASPDDGPAPH